MTSSTLALQQYILERIKLFDSALDTSAGSTVQSVVIAPLLNRLGTDPLSTDIQSFIVQRLRDEFPNLDIDSPGNSWQDVIVAPLIMLLEPLRREIQHLKQQSSLADSASLNQDEIDALLANIFAERGLGSFAFTTVRVFFSAPRTVGIDGAISFSTLSGVQFVCDTAKVYLPSDMTRSGNLWFIDVLLHSVEPLSTGNVAAGAINTVIGIDGVVKCTNLKAAGGGLTTESGDEFIRHAGQRLTERSLNSARAIETFITDNITGVSSIDVVGFGEPEMTRDIIRMNGTGWADGDAVTLSDMPGGVPFPGILGGTLTIPNNEIHIGGMTDVYLKTDSPIGNSVALYATSSDVLDTAAVLAQGSNGSIAIASPSIFSSASLVTALWILHNESVSDFHMGVVIEVIEPPVGFPTPLSFRALEIIDDSVRIDATFSTFVGEINNIKWRLIKNSVIDLVAPKIIFQQGTDLVTVQNQQTVTIGSNVTFSIDPALNALYLSIDTGLDQAEYRISGKTANTLILTTAVAHSGTALHFKVYTKQTSGLQLPLIQIKNASIGGLGTGVDIPYKHPVATSLSSVAGWNGTNFTQASNSWGSLDLTVSGGKTIATKGAGTSFVGVVNVNDVVVFPYAAPNNYFYVTVVAADVLTLDRTSTLANPTTATTYKVGSPAIGDATILFKQPTYLGITQNTVFSYTAPDATVFKFRPSPTDFGYRYNPAMNLASDFVASSTTVLVTHKDIYALGVSVGDKVVVKTRVLRSANFIDADWTAGITISGMVLTVLVDGVEKAVQFLGTNPLTPQQVATRLNQVLGSVLFAEAKVLPGDNNEIRIHSAHTLVLSNGTSTPLTALKMDGSDAAPSSHSSSNNTSPNTGLGDHAISAIADNLDGTYTITLASAAITDAVNTDIFCVRIKTVGSQYFFPKDMVLQPNGMYACTAKVTSYDPFEQDVVPLGSEASIATYSSLGYDLVVGNPAYSFSIGEKISFSSTAVVMAPNAVDFSSVFAVPASSITIDYDYAPEVGTTQNFLLRQTTRIVNNNPLAKHFLPAYPVFVIQYSGNEDDTVVSTKISDYLKTLYPNKTLEVFDLLRVLNRLNIDDVTGPVEVAFLKQDSSRTQTLARSKNSVTLSKCYHVMGELDFVTITRG